MSDRGEARFLQALGERVRGERARRGLTRRALAESAAISERYVTQLETGKGNASVLILRRLSAALGVPLARLVAEDGGGRVSPRTERIAFVGLRGAGKTTLASALAKDRGVPFVELDREVERLAGTPLASLFEMYGAGAYRRYEREALERLLETHERFTVAAGGGLVTEPPTYELLLSRCFTVWVRTSPEEHMARVLAQGDRRPVEGSAAAMDDLRRILAERTPLYARADLTLDTAGARPERSLRDLKTRLKRAGAAAPDVAK